MTTTNPNSPHYQRLLIAFLVAAILMLYSCTTSYRWMAIPIKTTVTNGVPGYKVTGRAIPINDSMDNKPGYLFKKNKY